MRNGTAGNTLKFLYFVMEKFIRQQKRQSRTIFIGLDCNSLTVMEMFGDNPRHRECHIYCANYWLVSDILKKNYKLRYSRIMHQLEGLYQPWHEVTQICIYLFINFVFVHHIMCVCARARPYLCKRETERGHLESKHTSHYVKPIRVLFISKHFP